MMNIDKTALLQTLREQIQVELDRATRRAQDAAEAATHEENRPEGDKDMRATEASYVARGQAGRVRELEAALTKLEGVVVRDFAEGDAIAVSALVDLDHGKQRKTRVFLLPAGGGERLATAAGEVQTVAVSSPLGAALLGLVEGDEAEVRTPQGTRTVCVDRVR